MSMLRAGALMIAALAAAAGPGLAQSQAVPEEESGAGVSTEEQIAEGERRVFTDQIVVTPGRQEQASSDAPAPVTVFDREAIEKIQPEKMADLFKAVPGVEIEGAGPSYANPA